MEERLSVGVEEAASLLGVKRDLVFRLINSDELPSYRIGGRRLIAVAALREYVEKQTEASVAAR